MITYIKSLSQHPITLLIALLFGLAFLCWAMWISGFGFDITDEGYYLHWMARPGLYHSSSTQFGYLYHPIYKLVEGDIAALRRINFISLFLAAWALTSALLQAKKIEAFLLAFPVWAFFVIWLPSPSYNSLNLLAVLITATGITHLLYRHRLYDWVWIGIGGYLATMAKPTTAILLAVVVLLALGIEKRLRITGILVATTVALGLISLSIFIIDGSVSAFLTRLQTNLADVNLLAGTGYAATIWRVDLPHLTFYELIAFAGLTSLTLTAVLRPGWWLKLTLGLLCVIGFFPLIGSTPFSPSPYFTVLYLAPFVGVVIGNFWRRYCPSRTNIILSIILLMMPHIYAFGTGNNYWATGGSAAICWVLAAVILSPRHASIIAILSLALTSFLLDIATQHPYRQAYPLEEQQHRVQGLKVTDQLAAAIAAWEDSDFLLGSYVIDMSGQSPGLVYLVGGLAPAYAWTLGGYPGSADLLRSKLATLDCPTLHGSWILVEPGGARSLPLSVLAEVGIDLSRYTKSGPLPAPAGVGEPVRIQYLYRPPASLPCPEQP